MEQPISLPDRSFPAHLETWPGAVLAPRGAHFAQHNTLGPFGIRFLHHPMLFLHLEDTILHSTLSPSPPILRCFASTTGALGGRGRLWVYAVDNRDCFE
jgi:hypothetical protein